MTMCLVKQLSNWREMQIISYNADPGYGRAVNRLVAQLDEIPPT